MPFIRTTCAGLILLLLSGCAASISRSGYKIDQAKEVANCATPIKLQANLRDSDVEKLGSIRAYDVNLISVDCDEATILEIVRKDSCYLGADLINITEEKQPDYLFSVCYQIKADFVKFKTPQKAGVTTSDPQYEWSKVQERGEVSRKKGMQAYGIAAGAGAAGAAVAAH